MQIFVKKRMRSNGMPMLFQVGSLASHATIIVLWRLRIVNPTYLHISMTICIETYQKTISRGELTPFQVVIMFRHVQEFCL